MPLDSKDVRVDWRTGETIVRNYALVEWGYLFAAGICGFLLSIPVPKGLSVGTIPVALFVGLIVFSLGVAAAEWRKLHRERADKSAIMPHDDFPHKS